MPGDKYWSFPLRWGGVVRIGRWCLKLAHSGHSGQYGLSDIYEVGTNIVVGSTDCLNRVEKIGLVRKG